MMWIDVFPLWPLMALSTAGFGAFARRILLRSQRLARSEVLAWDFLLGSGLAGYLVFAAGFLGLLHPATGWVLLACGALIGIAELKAVGVANPLRGASWDVRALHLLTALALLWQMWGCLTPEFGGDALNYHLGAPRDWIDAGRIVDSPLRFQAAIPGHHLMIYTWCLLIGGDVLCKLIQTTQFLAAAVLIASLGRRLAGRRAGALAACFAVMSISAAWYRAPVFARSDLMALMFSAGACWAMMRLVQSGQVRWAAAVGVSCGLALVTKYTAIPFLIIPVATALALELAIQRLSPRAIAAAGAFALFTAGLMASPWLLREWATTGDPLYPLLSDHLRIDPDYDESRQAMAAYQASYQISQAPYLSHDRWLLWKRRMRDASTEGDFLVVPLALLSPLALFMRWRGLRALGLFGVAATLLFATISVAEIGRFFLITAPVSAAILAWGLDSLARRVRWGPALAAASGAVALAVVVQHQVFWSLKPTIDWFGQPVMTRQAADHFVRKRTPDFLWVVPAYQWIDANLPADARVLCINHPYAYRLPRPHWTRGRWNIEIYDWLLARLGSPEAVTARLRAEGITHIFRQGDAFRIDPSYWGWERASADVVWHGGNVWVLALRR